MNLEVEPGKFFKPRMDANQHESKTDKWLPAVKDPKSIRFRRQTLLIVLALAALFYSFKRSAPSSSPDWQREDLVGHQLTLVDPSSVEQYSFDGNGMGGASLGSKDIVTGPAFYWKLEKGWLRIYDDGVPIVYQELRLIDRGRWTITAMNRSGAIVKYRTKKVDLAH